MKKLITLTVCFFTLFGIAKADDDKPISVKELPKNALEFIQKYFPKNEVSYAKLEKDLWDKKYEVVFVNGEKIEFDKNGGWKEVECKFSSVPEAIIPEQIKTYITKHYPEVKVLKIERDSKKYEVKLSNKLELKFNLQFQLIEIDD